ncbi:MAG: hypothetical protein JWR88_1379 [Pseudonocardia sp.]|jgi:hypothetical protein|nr:hypothetical protein [Pseudonocardia sp.]
MTSSPSEHTAQDPQAAIDAAMVALGDLGTVPVGEHPEAFDRVHIALADALSAIDGV